MISSGRRKLLIIAFLFAAIGPTWYSLGSGQEPEWPADTTDQAEEISLSELRAELDEPVKGRKAGVLGDYIYLRTPLSSLEKSARADTAPTLEGGDHVTTRSRLPFPADDMISEIVANARVPVKIHENPGYRTTWTDRFFQILPILIILGIVLLIFSRGATRGLGLNASFNVIDSDNIKEDFGQVAGIDTARDEIQEIIDFLRNPEDSGRLGGQMPKGAIFSGPPGTGKTLLARAMAREARVSFLSIEASGVNQLFVGAGAMKVKKAFREARKRAPCIVFIDEIDAMGRARGSAHSGAGEEKETTLNALLVELDGFDSREGVVVIAATNRPEILDPALTRRGRIDRRIHIDLPDIKGREEILRVHVRKIRIAETTDLAGIARTTFGFSGADLAALANEAALTATRSGKTHVENEDFQSARDRLVIGLSGSRRELTGADRRTTAIHEAGHSLIAGCSPETDRIEKASILPQGGALGFVMQSPDEDRFFERYSHLTARMRVIVAGRVAEEKILGQDSITTGAASDIEAATRIARSMVARFGMSSSGFVAIDSRDPLLLDDSALRHIRQIIEAEKDAVGRFIDDHKDVLEKIADALEEYETISGHHIHEIIGDLAGSFDADAYKADHG